MTRVRTRTLAIWGVLGGALPVLVLVGRALYVWRRPVELEVLVVDVSIMGGAILGTLGLLGMHLHSSVARPLGDVQSAVRQMQEGRFDIRIDPGGPAEVQELAAEVEALARHVEQRLHLVTHVSGVTALGSVLTGVAHEVSNPLAAMRLSLHVAQQRAQANGEDQVHAALARLERGIDRLEGTVETLRQAGGAPDMYEPALLVQAALIVAQRALLRCDVRVHGEATHELSCRPGEVVQALAAVLENSAQAGARSVDVRIQDLERGVAFIVEDDGDGIPEAIRGHATEPFVTARPGRVGLGLHHAQGTAHAHGGGLEIVRTETGTRVTLWMTGL